MTLFDLDASLGEIVQVQAGFLGKVGKVVAIMAKEISEAVLRVHELARLKVLTLH